eukprot:scaffold16219_cov102-Isochrysis_galbana.AAC.19
MSAEAGMAIWQHRRKPAHSLGSSHTRQPSRWRSMPMMESTAFGQCTSAWMTVRIVRSGSGSSRTMASSAATSSTWVKTARSFMQDWIASISALSGTAAGSSVCSSTSSCRAGATAGSACSSRASASRISSGGSLNSACSAGASCGGVSDGSRGTTKPGGWAPAARSSSTSSTSARGMAPPSAAARSESV